VFDRGWSFDDAPREPLPVVLAPVFVLTALAGFAFKSVVWLFLVEGSCYVLFAMAAAIGYLHALLVIAMLRHEASDDAARRHTPLRYRATLSW
jgi:hypothetical protein